MCPEFERIERIVQKMVDKSEKVQRPVIKLRFVLSIRPYAD